MTATFTKETMLTISSSYNFVCISLENKDLSVSQAIQAQEGDNRAIEECDFVKSMIPESWEKGYFYTNNECSKLRLSTKRKVYLFTFHSYDVVHVEITSRTK